MIADFEEYSARKVVGLEVPEKLKLDGTSDPTMAHCLLPEIRNMCGSYQSTEY